MPTHKAVKMTRAQSLAVKHWTEIEAGLLLGDWSKTRSAAIQLAALADSRAQREVKK
ncbi:MAG: hypothetical protein ABSC15_17030 [Terriglobales bacterium]|jgi:hypothetical protein